jgi:hypothetical protein
MTDDKTDHWQAVYQRKQPTQVSWFAPHLGLSMALLKQVGLNPTLRLIDIGAGASTLVDDLLDMGLHNITLLDISPAALHVTKERLGARADRVQWLIADAARMDLPAASYDLWHDRAAFHFLIEAADTASYVAAAKHAIVDGGFAIIGGFAADGPERCSGLPVARREPEDVAQLFGPAFELVHAAHERHTTPSGVAQAFAYTVLRKVIAV